MLKIKKFLIMLGLVAAAMPVTADTVAYWRFENGVDGELISHTTDNNVYSLGVQDVSGNGNHLSSYSTASWANLSYIADVACPVIPQTGQANYFSVTPAGNYPALATYSASSNPSGTDLEAIAPTAWTVEVIFKPENKNRSEYRSVVGRDGYNVSPGDSERTSFNLQCTKDEQMAVNFTDGAGNWWSAKSAVNYVEGYSYGSPENGTWYAVAAVCDGSALKLYSANISKGEGYQLLATTYLDTTDASISIATDGGAEGLPGHWTVARSLWNGGHSNRCFAIIDEVRISDSALEPADFLFSGGVVSAPSDVMVWTEDKDSAAFSTESIAYPYNSTVASADWYKGSKKLTIDGSRYVVTTTKTGSTLIVNDITEADAGSYHAIVAYTDGSSVSSDSASLQIANGLVHRWSFDGDLVDSISSADGTLYDPNSLCSFADGQLLINNEAGATPQDLASTGIDDPNHFSFVKLPDGIVSSLGNNMTIEMWVTPLEYSNYSGYATFSEMDGFFNGAVDGLFFQAARTNNNPSFYSRFGSSSTGLSLDNAAVAGEEVMLAAVWNGNNSTFSFYHNGELVGTAAANGILSDINDINNMIGVNFWNDPLAPMKINELRIYDCPLPSYYVAAHSVYGADDTNVILKAAISGPVDKKIYPAMRAGDDDTAEMTVTVTELPLALDIASVQWYFDTDGQINGNEVVIASDNINYMIEFSNSGTNLYVIDADEADQGYYYAELNVSNGQTSVSREAYLNVVDGLVHRWSFNGDLTDSVAGKDASIGGYAPLATFVDGKAINLASGTSSPSSDTKSVAYVSLPSGILNTHGNTLTIEMFVTPNEMRSGIYSLFGLGSFIEGDDNFHGGDGLFCTVIGGDAESQTPYAGVYYANGESKQKFYNADNAYIPSAGEELLYAIVWDGDSRTVTFYVIGENGSEVVTAALDSSVPDLSDMTDDNNMLGAYWNSDTALNGQINEFRIYDWAFDSQWVYAQYDAGADNANANPCVAQPEHDLNSDCVIDISDIAILAADWLECGRLDPCN